MPSPILIRLQASLPALLLALTGLAVLIGGSRYPSGSLTSMGPGFMPVLYGVLLLLLALVVLLLEWRTLPVVTSVVPLRPLLCAALSMLCWALLAERFGFVPSALVQLGLAYLAVPKQRWPQVLLSAAVLTLVAYLVFVVLLGLPLPAVGW